MIELQYYISVVPDCLLYGLLALGIYISLRILDIPDLTTEGSFGFGVVTSALVALSGHPYLALIVAMLGGAFAGIITGFLQTKLNVHPVLAGIITMSGFYSINLIFYSFTEKGATTNLSYNKITVFDKLKQALGVEGTFNISILKSVISLIIVAVVVIALVWFFKTHLGLCVRATGDNPDMVRASSINVDMTKITGLAIANGMIGLSGALISQSAGYADISSSSGTLIYGLAAVIIGEAIFGKRGATIGLISAVTGSVIYELIVAFVIRENIFGDKSANLMKLTCALIVAITLAVPAIKKWIIETKSKREARKNA